LLHVLTAKRKTKEVASRQIGVWSWRLLGPGKIKILVWSKSILEIIGRLQQR